VDIRLRSYFYDEMKSEEQANEKNAFPTPMNRGRVLALDLGKRRIGLALSDELGLTAQGLPTLERTNIREDLARLAELASGKGVTLILMGNPLHMSGREGRQAGHAREFGGRLEAATGLPVKYWDERLTTVEAQRVLRESGVGIEKRAKAVDRLAAVILLESYLDSLQP
jgi:putative holliday junction resolvase